MCIYINHLRFRSDISARDTYMCVRVCVCIYSDISALQNRARAQTQAAKRCDALQYPATYCNTLKHTAPKSQMCVDA